MKFITFGSDPEERERVVPAPKKTTAAGDNVEGIASGITTGFGTAIGVVLGLGTAGYAIKKLKGG
jgi:hypothetical protein